MRARPRRTALFAVAMLLALVPISVGCGSPSPDTTDSPSPARSSIPTSSGAPTTMSPPDAAPLRPSGAPSELARGLEAPWGLAFGDGFTLIGERDTGRILRLSADGGLTELIRVDDVVHGGEGGLLGLTLDGTGRLYAYSTGPQGNRVQRFPLDASGTTPGAPETLIGGLPSARNHNGGQLAIGPDGMLYVSVGDAGDRAAAQDPASQAGKILRLTLDGGLPSDNPFPGSAVFSLGHRNVQGIAWAADGRMFASEFGQDTWDELNEVIPGGNYGWPEAEGMSGVDGFIDPIAQWAPSDASPSGIAVAGGSLILANLRGSSLRAVPIADPGAERVYLDGALGRIRTALLAPDGTLWILTNNTDGRGSPAEGDDRLLSIPLSPTP
ncbi:glucose/arabinose dehydrogenase [Microbacterium resistens]|uniref:Glucose/arabinose dehydrogenase n=1 Tax=Microbacterium resistens TaxID=156977 RepID=A0ABU1S8Q1_9MICO|nr:PQQ-dependent sugar dehydrogenase [Microbacterium resistens]MDR6865935.1 glucose/arabinose dehydrogenase [Microbacterium resistens]